MSNEDLGSPVHDRSGPTVDESVAKAEEDSQVEGIHTPSGQEKSGESRVEQMPEVRGVDEPRIDGDPATSGAPSPPVPGPGDIGAGGAQRIEGARVSDRVAAGESVPDGPPFETDSGGSPQENSGAGA
jgi:hypothetical protein